MCALPWRRGLSTLGCALACFLLPASGIAAAQNNAGTLPAATQLPFQVQRIATLDHPWAMAFLPDGRLLITEKPGRLQLVTPAGKQTAVQGVPEVYDHGQTGLHDVALSTGFAQDRRIYLSYVAPAPGGGVLTLARARLVESADPPRLDELQVLWRQQPAARSGHPGAQIVFDPQGRHLYLSVGERQQSDTAQDPNAARGKILRMLPDGSVPPDNPQAAAGGIQALTWSTGHRNPYGLAFAPDGQLWEHEMGPRGGDELNRIQPGKNYGWPIVSNGSNYSGIPIPDHDTRPEFEPPVLYWTPVIAPAGMAFYQGAMFPSWDGSILIGGLVAKGLVRVVIQADGAARQADRWSLGERIRDVAVAADGAVWVVEDGRKAGLLRLSAPR